MHDRIAELCGLRNELASSRRSNADEVQGQIDRVRGELEGQATALEGQAKGLIEQGQDGAAGQATEDARRIREALAEDDARTGRGAPRGKENAADSRPKQTASGRGSRTSSKS
ncbi:hypothetical protein ABZ504_03195 [Streptomyces mirabilis]|uniref:hypothetical protein n=1 Tax=Streptomyces mirabilis TaxID=68239 RepID=UPI0033F34F8E